MSGKTSALRRVRRSPVHFVSLLVVLFLVLAAITNAEKLSPSRSVPQANDELVPPQPSDVVRNEHHVEDSGAASVVPPETIEVTAEEMARQRREARQAKGEAALKAGKQDYSSVKEDFLCRACMALTTTFFDKVLTPASEKYAKFAQQKADGGKPRGIRKESMVAEVHENIDGLCAQVKAMHAELTASIERGERAAEPGGSKTNIYEGIDVACASALEQLDEAFATTAFKVLMPKTFAPGEDVEEGEGGHEGTDAKPKTNRDEASIEKVYVLPRAGTFCEQHKLCSPYLHYHITSEESVDLKRRMAEIKAKAAELKQHQKTLDAKREWETAQRKKGLGGVYSESDRAADTETLGKARKKHRKDADEGKDSIKYLNTKDDEETTLGVLLSHPVKLLKDAVTSLRRSSNQIVSEDFWRMMMTFAMDDAVWFHMLPQWKFLIAGTFVVLGVTTLMAACMLCCCCCETCFSGEAKQEPSVKQAKGPKEASRPSAASSAKKPVTKATAAQKGKSEASAGSKKRN